MRYYPIFLDTRARRILVSGAGATAAAKIALILKTEARVEVYGAEPCDRVLAWEAEGRLLLVQRALEAGDIGDARLIYAANDDAAEDLRARELGVAAGVLVNTVDQPDACDFITPAIVDRDPVTVAIGTEGTAPVLARQIKALNEEALSADTGTLARIGNSFRDRVAELEDGRARRDFWSAFYAEAGPRALKEGGEAAMIEALESLLEQFRQSSPKAGFVHLIGAGPGDPDLLTVKAQKLIRSADVLIHDRLVSGDILELARREADFIEVGKSPYGKSWSQDDINAVMVEHASRGARVVRLKSGDPGIYGRLDEEMDALDAAGIGFDIVPGITSAAAAASDIKVSLTRRHRNSSLRFLTGHDINGFADHDWVSLGRPGSVAAIYMGVRAAGFMQSRLLAHGADAATPVTAVENASRSSRKIVSATLGSLSDALEQGGIKGPTIIFLDLAPRDVERASNAMPRTIREEVPA